MKYDRNQNVSLLLYPISIKYLPNGTKVLHSLIALIIKEGDCSDAHKFVAHHCENCISKIQVVGVGQYYITMAHAE